MIDYKLCDENNNKYDNNCLSLADEKAFLSRMADYHNDWLNSQKDANKDIYCGTIGYPFATTDRHHFESFCFYLRSHGYDIIKSSYKLPYKVYVFGLTKQEAAMLSKRLYGDQNFTPFSGGDQAA